MLLSLASALLLATRLEFVVPDANFSLREGLPAVQVQSLYQDRFGALWVGTSAGLAQLGGPAIQVFGPEAGLARSTILAIAEEPTGAIVVGTATGTFRQVRDRFEPAGLPPAAAQLPVRRFIRGRDGTLWALAGERIVLRHSAGQWNAVGIDGALAFEATDFAVDDVGALWLATRTSGVLRLVSEGTRFRKSAQFQPVAGAIVAIDHVATVKGRVYFSSSRGLSVVSVATGGVVDTVPFPPGVSAGRRTLSVSDTGEVFVGTNAGVFVLSGRSLVPVGSRNDRSRAAVGSLLSDREGQLWVGTLDSGLNLLLRGRGVMFLRADKESFRSIDIDRSGVHWVSNERRVLHFRTDDAGNPLPANEARFEGFDALTIAGIVEDPAGGLLFALEGGVGFLSRSARARGAMTVQHDPRFDALRDRQVVSIHRDARDALWAVSPFGIYRLESGAREAESVPLDAGNPSMAALDLQGLLWVATRQGAMYSIDTANVAISAVPLPARRRVESVGPAPDRGAVVTFENGQSAFFSSTDGAARVATTNAPPELNWLSVASLQRVGDSYLAAHGGDRLSQIRLNPAVVEQTLLTSADLEDADFRYLSLREGRAGRMWFTLLNGIGRFDPPNAPPEPSRLRLDLEAQSVTLDPRPNSVDLHAQLSDPVAPRKARYRYRLVGESDVFSDWSSDTHIPLSNVPPGVFRLEVEAEDRYGRQARPISLEVVARAHTWETWPFRAGVVILALGGVYALYQGRVRAIEQERLDLAAAVKAGRADLEAANQRLQELSLTDMLTGLRNRRYFSEVVEDELRLLKRRYDDRTRDGDPNRDAVFFILDLDRFKAVNDRFGHAGGDAVLQTTARRLESLLRRTDRLIRWGGEEFLVISLDCRRSEAGELAARILAAISTEPYPIGPEGGIRMTTSIGWAAYPFSIDGTAAQAKDVVRLADQGLYRAKRAGRNCAVGVAPAGRDRDDATAPLSAVEVPEELGYPVVFTTVRGRPHA
jgi:diguanylate cyclase (GGDEF)-like protein